MEKIDLKTLQYPIGRFQVPSPITDDHLNAWIGVLDHLPTRMKTLVGKLTDAQLDVPYRPGGWSVRQLVHHVADSHVNSYIRFKWALTEDAPLIKVYDEKSWGDLFDARTAPVGLSLDTLQAVHAKMVYLLKGLSNNDLERMYIHPDGLKESTIKETIGRYAWHCDHHYAHIHNHLVREGWL